MNLPSRVSFRGCVSASLFLLLCTVSQAADVTWTGSTNSRWETGSNWNTGAVPTSADFAIIPSGNVNVASSSGTTPNIRGIRQAGGTINISGGTVEAGQVSQYSDFNGTVNQTGGVASFNMARIGAAANSNGSYVVGGGEFKIARARGNVSLNLGGLTSGNGSMTIAGGSFEARQSVRLGGSASTGKGTFSVMGSRASSITLGGNGVDGVWFQSAGSTLVLRFDAGGTTPIVLQDNEGSGTSATFESGSLLDVDHLTGDGGGTWTVLEVENADIVDSGLAFAPGVDTSIWSFAIDNSGVNGKLVVSAVGDPEGFSLVVGENEQQKMRYGMDYERLWFWTGGLNASERREVAKWSAIDTRIDFVRVAMNGGYELEEGTKDLSAYTNKIIPLMQAMQDANPDIKFFASPRPLNEAYPSKKWEGENVNWQPYPIWVTGAPTPISGNFDFQVDKCVQYIEDYLVLMDSYGFKIDFMDLTNEWQSNVGGGRITQTDFRDVVQDLQASTVLSSAGIEVPKFIGPSSWNYSQGASWISNLSTQQRRDAVNIAASHNTDKTGTAQQFGDAVRDRFSGSNDTMPEIWNTEVHGWKSTSSANETTTFSFYLEQIQAGFSGLTGWLAIGTTNQGHSYILNPNGSPERNVKYFIFKKLSETSNYGHALDMIEEPGQLSHTVALIKGNLMTVWVINQGASAVPVNIFPSGRTISESTVKRTRWTDPSDVEGFVTHEPVTSNETFWSSIPSESVCCFEILLDGKDYPYAVTQAEDEDSRIGMSQELSSDEDGTWNLANIDNDNWARYDDIMLTEDAAIRFRTARPSGRDDGWIEVYLGASGASSASILAGTPVGKVAVPETGDWQVYETIEASLENTPGKYDVILRFAEVGSSNGNALFNLNWLAVEAPQPVVAGVEMNFGETQRSTVQSLDIVFDGDVDVADGAVSVMQRTSLYAATNQAVSSSVFTVYDAVEDQTVATVQFNSHIRNGDNALDDGNYQLTLDADLVTRDGFPMSGDYVMGDVQADGFYSLYGDSNGDRRLNVFDVLAFRTTWRAREGDATFDPAMDYDGNGTMNIFDLLQFRTRYRLTLPFSF